MHRRHRLTHLILAAVVVLSLEPLMVTVEAQAQIAFASDRDGDNEIYVMDADGGNLRRLTNNSDSDKDPAWSPDGKRIAFKSDRDGHVNVHGWATHDIYVMDADGSNQQKLTNDPADDWDPSWSPNGKRIAFTSWRDGPFNIEVYVIDADGGNLQNLTNNPRDDRNPSWSPYGAHIAFSARRKGHFENKFSITHEIYVMDVDGGNQRRVTENRSNDWDPSWSPDSKRVVFVSRRNGNRDIYVMNADGLRQVRRLTKNGGNDLEPAWFDPAFAVEVGPFAVSPTDKKFTIWGRVKQVDR